MGETATIDSPGDELEPLEELGSPEIDVLASEDSLLSEGEEVSPLDSLTPDAAPDLEPAVEDLPSIDEPNDSQQNFDKAIEELSGMPVAGIPDSMTKSPTPSSIASEMDAMADASARILDIPVEVTIVLGNAQFSVGKLMSLQPGEVVELSRQLGEPLDVMVNGRNIAKGELTAMEGDESRFGIRITELTG